MVDQKHNEVDFTTVVAVDKKHLEQLNLTIKTWKKHKPSLFTDHPVLVIYDSEQVTFQDIYDVVGPITHLKTQPWPLPGVSYIQQEEGRWFDAQRQKMLSSFIYGAAERVRTKWWLKIDCDTVATGHDDWIDEKWFETNPAIVSHPWGYTKPPNQILELDAWVAKNENKLPALASQHPLNLHPNPGSDLVRHPRIISWCAFFHTEFTKRCAEMAEKTCGQGKLPVPSQDGFMWYCAERMGFPIIRPNMKARGWMHLSTMKGIREQSEKALQDGFEN